MADQKSDNRGFTLIETMAYLALMILVVGGYISFAMSMSALHRKMFIIQEVQANSRVSTNIMSQKIRSAATIVEPDVIGATSSALILNMSGAGVSTTTFSVINGVLSMIENSNEPINLTSSQVQVENLVFTRLSDVGDRANVAIEMLVKNKFGDSREYRYEQSVNTSISLRR